MPYNASKNSAEHHRVTPEPAVGPVFGSIMLGARSPDGAKRNPGTIKNLECRSWISLRFIQATTTNKKEAERRQAHVFRCSAPYGRGSR
jgi:hypothetical protein